MTAPASAQGRYDAVLVGGGLACGLVALAIRRRRPTARLAMIEAGPTLGGNHTWSFHGTDVDDEGAALLAPLVAHRWSGVEVRFPDHQRRLEGGYASITSASFAGPVRAALAGEGSLVLTGATAARLDRGGVTLSSGERLEGAVVFDGRGPAPTPTAAWVETLGFQSFVGLEIETEADVSAMFPRPILMDATVEQLGGLRFLYVLPFGPRRLLVEDTLYTTDPGLDPAAARARIVSYLDQRGLRGARVIREEQGVLPLPLSGDGLPPLGWPIRLGYRGGWMHPTTGYSLPIATRVALTIARVSPGDPLPALQELHRTLAPQAAYCRRLNRLLFRAIEPGARWRLLSRFYRLPPATIARFYALETTAVDRARLLVGRPPRGLSWRAAFRATQAV